MVISQRADALKSDLGVSSALAHGRFDYFLPSGLTHPLAFVILVIRNAVPGGGVLMKFEPQSSSDEFYNFSFPQRHHRPTITRSHSSLFLIPGFRLQGKTKTGKGKHARTTEKPPTRP